MFILYTIQKSLGIFKKNTLRLHFFNEKDNLYGVSLTITDSPMECISRGVFNLDVVAPKNFYVLSVKQKIHIMDKEYQIHTFPWMMQDTDVDVCAHVALWSLNAYLSYKLPRYRYLTIGEISLNTPNYLGRTIPSEGLNVLQISDVLLKMHYYPIILFKKELGQEQFFNALYSYLESGIPLLVGMDQKEHAFTIMGHGPINNKLSNDKQIVYNSELIKSYLAVDDNHIPFTIIGQEGIYKLDDIDYFLVPLPEKVFLNVTNVYKETPRDRIDVASRL